MDPTGAGPGIWQQLEGAYLVPKWWPVVASFYYYSFTICLASFLRNISRNIFPRKTVIYILDLITTFQVCACSLENASVRFYHGFPGYLFAVFTLATLHNVTHKGFRGNPLANVTGYMRNEQTLQKTILRMAFQMTGGLMSYRYAKTLWKFRLNDIHLTRADMLCRNDLSVDPTLGFLVEFAGTVFETYISFCTISSKPAIDLAVKQTIAIINLALAVELTGYYLNPANATAQTFGCGGSNPSIFIVVYWIGPIVATAGAVYLRSNLKTLLGRPDKGDPDHFIKKKRPRFRNFKRD